MERPVIPDTRSSEMIKITSDVIKIRAHHLLCMQGFQGYGYTRDFEHNLSEIIKYLDSNPNSRLKVVADADVICLKCPHLESGHCSRYSSLAIVDMDLKVLKKLDLEEGAIEPAQKLLGEIRTWNSQDLHAVCGECSWKDKCLLY